MKDTPKAEVSMSYSGNSRLARLVAAAGKEFFWGCKLTKDDQTATWSFEEEDDDMDYLQHTLFLKHAVLGSSAKQGERHVVQIETMNFEGENIVQPVLSMTAGKEDMCQLNIIFGHMVPVTLKLIEGSGPLYISAQHVVEFPEEVGEDDPLTVTDTETEADLETDVQNVEEEEDEGAKATKRKANGLTKASKKRGKFDSAPSEDEDDDDDDESADLDKNGDTEEDEEEESMDARDDDDDDDDTEDDSDEEYTEKIKPKKKGKDVKRKSSAKPVKETKSVPKKKKVSKRKAMK